MAAVIGLFDPSAHEPLSQTAWDAERARRAIRAIVAETERAFTDEAFWPVHPRDVEPDDPPLVRLAGVYLGAAGVISALHALGSERDWSGLAASLPDRYRAEPDFRDAGVVPSLFLGEAGILLVAHRLAPSRSIEDRLLEVVRSNAAHPSLEIFWGSPGTMLAAQVMHERTGDPEWAAAWNESAERLWAAWEGDVWRQDMLGRRRHVLGPAHGFAGNVHVLAGGDLLDGERRSELGQRAIAALERHARRAGGLAQWPPSLEEADRPDRIRTQWCHGAPGIVCSLAALAPRDERLTELLAAGGELTWQAGPLRKGAGVCHGTAGNGYAFLKLFERTGDERWLARARAFAMHAIEQVERTTAQYGHGWHSLWTGDPGTALYLQGCVSATAALPTLDTI